MSNSNKSQLPWLDAQARPLSTAQLRVVSKSWNAKTWESYLQSIEHTRSEHLADDFDDLVQQRDQEEALRRYYEAEFGESCENDKPNFDPAVFARAMSELPYLDREVLSLHFWEGKTQEEIADLLEHSRGTIRRRYLSALKKMKELLKDRIWDQRKNLEST